MCWTNVSLFFLTLRMLSFVLYVIVDMCVCDTDELMSKLRIYECIINETHMGIKSKWCTQLRNLLVQHFVIWICLTFNQKKYKNLHNQKKRGQKILCKVQSSRPVDPWVIKRKCFRKQLKYRKQNLDFVITSSTLTL